MKVAVTGASGFIGRHVLRELYGQGLHPIAIRRNRSVHEDDSISADVVYLDLHHAPDNAFDLMGRPDVLIHLAWSGLPNYRSRHHFEEELPAHYAFIRRLIESGLKRVVMAGTCFEYGMRSGPLSEDTAALPENAYGFAKNALLSQLTLLKADKPFKLVWARLFYLYGAGQSEGALLPQLQAAVMREDVVFNMSGGEQLRDYLPVTTAARYLVSLALDESDPGIVNICSGEPISIRRLVEGWIAENQWPIKPNLGYYPYPDHEPMAFWGDPSKLRSILGINCDR